MAKFQILAYNNLDTDGPYTFDQLAVVNGRGREEFPEGEDGGWEYFQYLKRVCTENGYKFKFYSIPSGEEYDLSIVVWRDEDEVERTNAEARMCLVEGLLGRNS